MTRPSRNTSMVRSEGAVHVNTTLTDDELLSATVADRFVTGCGPKSLAPSSAYCAVSGNASR
ncbi:hypothetical protein D3C73_1641210 [compost metagenome]